MSPGWMDGPTSGGCHPAREPTADEAGAVNDCQGLGLPLTRCHRGGGTRVPPTSRGGNTAVNGGSCWRRGACAVACAGQAWGHDPLPRSAAKFLEPPWGSAAGRGSRPPAGVQGVTDGVGAPCPSPLPCLTWGSPFFPSCHLSPSPSTQISPPGPK